MGIWLFYAGVNAAIALGFYEYSRAKGIPPYGAIPNAVASVCFFIYALFGG